jgi:hypothetical protein
MKYVNKFQDQAVSDSFSLNTFSLVVPLAFVVPYCL